MFVIVQPWDWLSIDATRFLIFKGLIEGINDADEEIRPHFFSLGVHDRFIELHKMGITLNWG